MTLLTQADNRTYFGVSGTGKSSLASSHSRVFKRVIICDWNTEPMHAHGATCVTSNPLELAAALRAKRFRVCWRRSQTSDKKMEPEEWYDFATEAALIVGDTLVIWDEAENGMPWGKMTDTARDMWNSGRHHGCRAFVISRSPFAVSRNVTRNVTRACIFRIIEQNDLRWLAGFIGKDAVRQVPALQNHFAVDWTADHPATVKKSYFA